MKVKHVARNISLIGKNTTIMLDPTSWNAVDWCASNAGVSWDDWVIAQLSKDPDTNNRAATVRIAAIRVLMDTLNSGVTGTVMATPQIVRDLKAIVRKYDSSNNRTARADAKAILEKHGSGLSL